MRNRIINNYPAIVCVSLAFLFSITIISKGNEAIIGSNYQGVLAYWSTWWIPQALINNYELVFNSHAIFPVGNNYLVSLSPLSSLFYFILRPFLGVALAYNSLAFLYSFLNSMTTYLWLRKLWGGNKFWSLCVSILLAYNPVTWFFLEQGNLPLMAFFVVPMCFILWEQFIDDPKYWRMVLVALSIYAILLMNFQYVSYIFTFLIPYFLFRAWKYRNNPLFIQKVLIAICLIALFLSQYPLSEILWSSYVDMYTPIEFVNYEFNSPIFLGGLLVLVVSISILNLSIEISLKRFLLFLLAIHIVFFIHIETNPLAIIAQLVPRFNFITPQILFIFPILLVCAALISAAADKLEALKSYQSKMLGIGFSLVFVLTSGWSIMIPHTAIPNIIGLHQITNETENYTLAFFPTGIMSSDNSWGSQAYSPLAMAYAPFHNKRVFGGISIGNLDDELAVYDTNPLTRILAHLTVDSPIESVPLIRADVERWRLAYIIVPNEVITDTSGLNQWLIWSDTFCRIEVEGMRELWRAKWHPNACSYPYTIDIGSPNDYFAIQSGWTVSEDWGDIDIRWSNDTTSSLIVWATPSQDYQLEIRMAAPQGYTQEILVFANDLELDTITINSDWELYYLTIPRTAIAANHQITLRFEHTNSLSIEGRMLNASYDYLILQPLD